MRRSRRQTHDAPQAFLDERERGGVNPGQRRTGSRRRHHLACVAHDLPDHEGLSDDARSHGAVRSGQSSRSVISDAPSAVVGQRCSAV